MEKMRFETKNITNENIKKIFELFPNVTTESIGEDGKLKTAIDFEKLKQELSEVVIDGEESYDFTWVGKKEAMVEANRPIRKTLRPDRESSVDWENTQNIYIEGDNLEALKLLQESYLGKVKMIYIDPPYNTGKDFVYRDNFTQDKDSYEEELGVNDEEGNRLFLNTESNGRFHSDWCSMIYPRLKLAKNLLTEDGIIFISIDSNEQTNLKNICNEVFCERNFVSEFVWKCRNSLQHDEPLISTQTERILVYTKNREVWNSELCKFNRVRKPFDATEYKNPDNDPRGPWLSSGKTRNDGRPSYTVISPTGVEFTKPWIPSPLEFKRWEEEGLIWWGKNGDSIPRKKSFLKDFKGNAISDILFDEYTDEVKGENNLKRTKRWEIGTTESGSKYLKSLFDDKTIFDYPKPHTLIQYLIKISTEKDSVILDFFSGSGTLADACMRLNANDEGSRKYIIVQLPEIVENNKENKECIKFLNSINKPFNICEIGKERIRRAGKKIQSENPDKKIDVGFRVFKVDDTNMNDVYYTPSELQQGQLGLLESNIKSDRTDEDLLYGCLLDWGVELSLPHKVEIIDGKRVHIVDEDALVACFEDQVSESVMRKIAEMKPTRVVFKDGSFVGDANKINVEEIFKLISPETTVKVI